MRGGGGEAAFEGGVRSMVRVVGGRVGAVGRFVFDLGFWEEGVS